PAPAGWNQPGYAPGAGWRPADRVYWPVWEAYPWRPYPPHADILGVQGEDGPEGIDGTTHLLRGQVTLHAPAAGWRVTSALLRTWSDNRANWYWDGQLIRQNVQGPMGTEDGAGEPVGWLELYPEHVGALGGVYQLAIQNSNDYWYIPNPQGTAWEVCVWWERRPVGPYLPLVLKAP
ncbi:MAG: hypothetical protein GXY76_17835, partial [Chloroflexi bacterium]|nr:hypothetical protein [Chloroflexota bacterium]